MQRRKMATVKAKAIKKVEVKKPKVVKPVVKKAPKAAVKDSRPASKTVKSSAVNLTVSVYGLDGKVNGKISLPDAIFGAEINKKLIAQAVRVYQANKRQGDASTKTRGEVDGSTRKIYKQKGTGKARHGSLRAPIFVKGGIVHGPKPKDFNLEMPKKMRRKALFSVLSGKLADGEIKILSGLEKIAPKTKEFVSVLKGLELTVGKNKVLVITPDTFDNAKRSFSNLQGINSTSAQRLNALEALRHKMLILTKESVSEMEKHFLKND
jgi:large subunit ribosomal protein L4